MIGTERDPRRPLVLCVDDEPAVLSALGRALRGRTFEVQTAVDPHDALRRVGRDDVDLVVADQRMPGMSGVDFLARVQRASPATLRLMLTAHPDPAVLGGRVGGAVQHLLLKPWEQGPLLHTIEALLAAPVDVPAPAGDDADLLEQAILGDAEAYARLFRFHAPACWRLARLLLRSADGAGEALQETYRRGLERIGTFRRETPSREWFRSLTAACCRRLLPTARWTGGADEDIASLIRQPETSAAVAGALARLTSAQREAFVLHYVEGLPYRHVASVMGSSPGAVRVLAQRARHLLQGRVPPPGPLST